LVVRLLRRGMQAIAVRRGESAPVVIEKPRPEPAAGEALVRTLRVGVDGTDHEVIRGGHGGFPAGEDHLVLGHEAVGVVEDPNGTRFSEGDVVVPTVRRPPGESNEYFERGEPDMAPEGAYFERGIEGAHGFMAEYFTSPGEYLVRIPASQASLGFLIEPISIAEKALELATQTRAGFQWAPESALVLGNGSLGLMTLTMLQRSFDRVYCLGRRDRPDPTVDIIDGLGATYVDSRETPVDEIPGPHEEMDLVVEATGYARHPLQAVHALSSNGVAALLGVPGPWEFDVDGGSLHREFVMGNKAMVGSVNSRVEHFESAIVSLANMSDWFLEDLVTGVYPLSAFERAFEDDDTTIKTAVEFGTHEERR
jgi:threonine dehydrogenase-like Zn-dependent dehydrogenase